MITQAYHCTHCGQGSVMHACNAGVSEVCTIIKADHRQMRALMTGCLKMFQFLMPTLFDDIKGSE